MPDFGLIGATGIAERALIGPARDRDDVRIVAVAASDFHRAEAYAARNGIPHVAKDYAGLIADPRVDAIYISLHNSAHAEWARRAAEAGKHVIVEKPICLDTAEWNRIVEAARETHVIEAVPTEGHEWQRAVREIGTLIRIETRMCFTDLVPGSYRERPELGGGIFLDVASYWLQALQAVAGLAGATGSSRARATGLYGADCETHVRLQTPTGVIAELEASVGGRHASEHVFVFEHARVRLRHFLRPTAGKLPLNLVITDESGGKVIRGFPPASAYADQLDRIVRRLSTPRPDRADRTATAERVALMAQLRPDGRSFERKA
uniref:Putative oxidoreductase n=1 Tax=Amycolatopsis sp. SANK 60206 TaxID=1642649 RepID=A0A0E3Z9N9_9PSEU|nr:putative oxidoreductase [Amycolatopsis sp. SANK 60206]